MTQVACFLQLICKPSRPELSWSIIAYFHLLLYADLSRNLRQPYDDITSQTYCAGYCIPLPAHPSHRSSAWFTNPSVFGQLILDISRQPCAPTSTAGPPPLDSVQRGRSNLHLRTLQWLSTPYVFRLQDRPFAVRVHARWPTPHSLTSCLVAQLLFSGSDYYLVTYNCLVIFSFCRVSYFFLHSEKRGRRNCKLRSEEPSRSFSCGLLFLFLLFACYLFHPGWPSDICASKTPEANLVDQ